jgi:hypothetical protein
MQAHKLCVEVGERQQGAKTDRSNSVALVSRAARPDEADSRIAFRPDCAGPPSQALRRNGKIRRRGSGFARRHGGMAKVSRRENPASPQNRPHLNNQWLQPRGGSTQDLRQERETGQLQRPIEILWMLDRCRRAAGMVRQRIFGELIADAQLGNRRRKPKSPAAFVNTSFGLRRAELDHLFQSASRCRQNFTGDRDRRACRRAFPRHRRGTLARHGTPVCHGMRDRRGTCDRGGKRVRREIQVRASANGASQTVHPTKDLRSKGRSCTHTSRGRSSRRRTNSTGTHSKNIGPSEPDRAPQSRRPHWPLH